MSTPLLPHLLTQHMGALHPVEQALTVLLAFGPFAVLAVVVVLRRRQDRREEPSAEQPAADGPEAQPRPQGQRDR